MTMETEQIVDPDKSWRRSTKSLFKSIKHAFGVSSKKKRELKNWNAWVGVLGILSVLLILLNFM